MMTSSVISPNKGKAKSLSGITTRCPPFLESTPFLGPDRARCLSDRSLVLCVCAWASWALLRHSDVTPKADLSTAPPPKREERAEQSIERRNEGSCLEHGGVKRMITEKRKSTCQNSSEPDPKTMSSLRSVCIHACVCVHHRRERKILPSSSNAQSLGILLMGCQFWGEIQKCSTVFSYFQA